MFFAALLWRNTGNSFLYISLTHAYHGFPSSKHEWWDTFVKSVTPRNNEHKFHRQSGGSTNFKQLGVQTCFFWRGRRISLEGISLEDQETKPRRGLLKDLLEETWLPTSQTFYCPLNVKLCVRQYKMIQVRWGDRMSSNDIVSISTEMTGCGASWYGSLRRAVAARPGRFAASHLDAWPQIILLVKPEIEIEWITLGSTLLKLSLRNELCPHN